MGLLVSATAASDEQHVQRLLVSALDSLLAPLLLSLLLSVRVERGDYAEGQLAERMNQGELVGDIVTHWLRLSERRKTIAFATGVAHSVHIRDEFRRAGIMAELTNDEF